MRELPSRRRQGKEALVMTWPELEQHLSDVEYFDLVDELADLEGEPHHFQLLAVGNSGSEPRWGAPHGRETVAAPLPAPVAPPITSGATIPTLREQPSLTPPRAAGGVHRERPADPDALGPAGRAEPFKHARGYADCHAGHVAVAWIDGERKCQTCVYGPEDVESPGGVGPRPGA